jgi:phage terminase small subunit
MNKHGGDMAKARAARGARKILPRGDDGLLPKQAAFVREYVKDSHGTRAAVAAGYSPKTACEMASALLGSPNIQTAIRLKLAAASDAADVSAELIISEIYQVAMADPRDLMRVETDSCRHCYGISGQREWTPAEYERDLRKNLKEGLPAPEMAGGLAFDPRRPPVESCRECFGRGVERVVITPSKKLSKGASKLLSSMRQTKDGIEIKTHDKMAALVALGRVRGIFLDRSELAGPGGGPIALTAVPNYEVMSDEDLRAALARSGGPPLLEATLTATQHQGDDNDNE